MQGRANQTKATIEPDVVRPDTGRLTVIPTPEAQSYWARACATYLEVLRGEEEVLRTPRSASYDVHPSHTGPRAS